MLSVLSTVARVEIIGDAILVLGDCADILPLIESANALLTDPPFGIGERQGTISKERNRNAYEGFDDTPENVRDNIIPRIIAALALAERGLIIPGGKCYHFYPPATDIGMFYQPAACGMTHWGRTTCQPILFYGLDPMRGKTIQPLHYQLTEAAEKNGHPCPKPLRAMKWAVNRVSLQRETIIDPFMGSGTSGVAAVQLGRKFIGIEINESYFEIACRRIREATNQGDLFMETPHPEKPKMEAML